MLEGGEGRSSQSVQETTEQMMKIEARLLHMGDLFFCFTGAAHQFSRGKRNWVTGGKRGTGRG